MINFILLFLIRKLYSLTNQKLMNNLHSSIEEQFKNHVLSRVHQKYQPCCSVTDVVYDGSVLKSLKLNLSFINAYKFLIILEVKNLHDFEIFIEDIDCRDIIILTTVLIEINEGLKAFKLYINALMKAHYGNLGLI